MRHVSLRVCGFKEGGQKPYGTGGARKIQRWPFTSVGVNGKIPSKNLKKGWAGNVELVHLLTVALKACRGASPCGEARRKSNGTSVLKMRKKSNDK